MKLYKFYDHQNKTYSRHNTIKGLYKILLNWLCGCEEGSDAKCKYCVMYDNSETATEQEMLDFIHKNDYKETEIKEGMTVELYYDAEGYDNWLKKLRGQYSIAEIDYKYERIRLEGVKEKWIDVILIANLWEEQVK